MARCSPAWIEAGGSAESSSTVGNSKYRWNRVISSCSGRSSTTVGEAAESGSSRTSSPTGPVARSLVSCLTGGPKLPSAPASQTDSGGSCSATTPSAAVANGSLLPHAEAYFHPIAPQTVPVAMPTIREEYSAMLALYEDSCTSALLCSKQGSSCSRSSVESVRSKPCLRDLFEPPRVYGVPRESLTNARLHILHTTPACFAFSSLWEVASNS